ncbi:hypothetical protein FKW77_004413 [Venturia effusa]|uniref:Uncharacterized protein n=1 Tax=Venturia effusa TaxID=50376 RepID=A0A517KZB8_9PEZI|nr:hypothetical protein FKW77_004413 [Venturia effusa]
MSLQRCDTAQNVASTIPDECLLDTILEPEFARKTSYRALIDFQDPNQAPLHDQSVQYNEPQGTSAQLTGSNSMPHGIHGQQHAVMYRQQVYLADTQSDYTQSDSSFQTCSSSIDSPHTHMYQEKNHLADSVEDCLKSPGSFGRASDFDSQRTQVQDEQKCAVMPQKEQAKPDHSPRAPPSIDEYTRNVKCHYRDPQKPTLPSTTSSQIPATGKDQYPSMQKQSNYVPHFSRPFSRSNPSAASGAARRARKCPQRNQEDIEQNFMRRLPRDAESQGTRRIEVLQREVELIDQRNDELNRAIEILGEAEEELRKIRELEKDEDIDDYDYSKMRE